MNTIYRDFPPVPEEQAIRIRKEAVNSILNTAAEYLEEFDKSDKIPAGRFIIWLFWSLQESPDGNKFKVNSKPQGE